METKWSVILSLLASMNIRTLSPADNDCETWMSLKVRFMLNGEDTVEPEMVRFPTPHLAFYEVRIAQVDGEHPSDTAQRVQERLSAQFDTSTRPRVHIGWTESENPSRISYLPTTPKWDNEIRNRWNDWKSGKNGKQC